MADRGSYRSGGEGNLQGLPDRSGSESRLRYRCVSVCVCMCRHAGRATVVFVFFFLTVVFTFFLIRVQLLYNVVLVSAVQGSESAMCIHISLPSWVSLPPWPLLFNSTFFIVQLFYNPRVSLPFCCCFDFWLYPTACGILVHQPGIKPVPNHWTSRKVPPEIFLRKQVYLCMAALL